MTNAEFLAVDEKQKMELIGNFKTKSFFLSFYFHSLYLLDKLCFEKVTSFKVLYAHQQTDYQFLVSSKVLAAKPTTWRVRRLGEMDAVTFFFFQYFFKTILSQWDLSHGKFGLLSPGNASCKRGMLPNPQCTLGVSVSA